VIFETRRRRPDPDPWLRARAIRYHAALQLTESATRAGPLCFWRPGARSGARSPPTGSMPPGSPCPVPERYGGRRPGPVVHAARWYSWMSPPSTGHLWMAVVRSTTRSRAIFVSIRFPLSSHIFGCIQKESKHRSVGLGHRSDEGGEDSAPDPHHEEASAPLPSAPGPTDSERQATAVLTADVKSRSRPLSCGHRKIPPLTQLGSGRPIGFRRSQARRQPRAKRSATGAALAAQEST
jgi:hypothetical protein